MKITLFLLLLIALCMENEALMTLDGFKNNIQPYCFKNWEEIKLENRQTAVIPYSIESFIGLVEKLERHPKVGSSWFNTISSVAGALLLNFRYDDAQYERESLGFFTRGTDGVKQSHIITKSIFEKSSLPADRIEEVFSLDERCALFFMLSHTVNTTYRDGEEFDSEKNKREAKYPIEQGVVSLASDQSHAFALGKVLLGILAGHQFPTNEEIPANTFYKSESVGSIEATKQLSNVNISPLYAVTFGDIIAVPMTEGNFKDAPVFQHSGYWKEIVCPRDYILDGINKEKHSTYALIRGALDGYALGKYIKSSTVMSSLRLSQILRMYYSGISFSENSELSVCSRMQLWKNLKNELQGVAANYEKLHTRLLDKTVNDQVIPEYCERVISTIESQASSIFEITKVYNCDSAPYAGKMRFDTPMDLMAIIDTKADDTKKQAQSEIIGNLSSSFQMRTDGSLASVFTNRKPTQGLSHGVEAVLNQSRISGCAGCAAKYYELMTSNTLAAVSDIEVLKNLNKTLTGITDEDEKNNNDNGSPAKVVLYFNFANPTKPDHQMTQVLKDLRHYFRGTSMYAIGSQKSGLDEYVVDKERDVFAYTEGNVPDIVRDLENRIQKVPAEFQFGNCDLNNFDQEETEIYEGFISPHTYQYWAMYPKYFIKSFDITLKFKAEFGNYQVCFSRDYSKIFSSVPPQRDRRVECIDVKSGEPEVTFTESNPCRKRDLDTCDPFYFFLSGSQGSQNLCTDIHCADSNQIKFTFSHRGISCNTASRLSAVFTVFITMLSVLLFRVH